MDEGWVKVDLFDTCQQLLLYDSASEHFGKGLMAETHSQNLKFWVELNPLLQSANKSHELWCLVVDG